MILSHPVLSRAWRGAGALALSTLLLACSSAPSRPEPAPLQPDPKLLGMRQAWGIDIGRVDFPLVLQVAGNTVGVASSEGQVSLLDTRTGEPVWRAEVGVPLNAGVGHDGRMAAVVTTENELVALQEGRELWRQRLNAPSYTAPLVAGGGSSCWVRTAAFPTTTARAAGACGASRVAAKPWCCASPAC